jgi:hypothetical protein
VAEGLIEQLKYEIRIKPLEVKNNKYCPGPEVFKEFIEARDCSQAMDDGWKIYNKGKFLRKKDFVLIGKPIWGAYHEL